MIYDICSNILVIWSTLTYATPLSTASDRKVPITTLTLWPSHLHNVPSLIHIGVVISTADIQMAITNIIYYYHPLAQLTRSSNKNWEAWSSEPHLQLRIRFLSILLLLLLWYADVCNVHTSARKMLKCKKCIVFIARCVVEVALFGHLAIILN